MKPRDRIILALDVSDYDEAIAIVNTFREHVDIFKVGSELFTASGPRIIKQIHLIRKKVFLDLKFHDIPNTVARSAAVAARLGVFMLNVHALGGLEMMRQAAEAIQKISLDENISRPKLVGVTILTSIDRNVLRDELGIGLRMSAQVKHLAGLAQRAGLDGVVASPEDAEALRAHFGNNFIIVTPGIRPSWAEAGDQKRILTPREALKRGSDYLVIGRAVTAQPDPVGALMRIKEEIAGF